MSTSLKTISVYKGLDTIINEGISVFRRFGKENSAINATDFYAGNRFALFIDLRSMRDKDLHGSGLKLVNKKEVELGINRKASGSGNVECHIFILSDAQLIIINRGLESVTSHLQRRDFNRRTNQGTPQHFCEKIQH